MPKFRRHSVLAANCVAALFSLTLARQVGGEISLPVDTRPPIRRTRNIFDNYDGFFLRNSDREEQEVAELESSDTGNNEKPPVDVGQPSAAKDGSDAGEEISVAPAANRNEGADVLDLDGTSSLSEIKNDSTASISPPEGEESAIVPLLAPSNVSSTVADPAPAPAAETASVPATNVEKPPSVFNAPRFEDYNSAVAMPLARNAEQPSVVVETPQTDDSAPIGVATVEPINVASAPHFPRENKNADPLSIVAFVTKAPLVNDNTAAIEIPIIGNDLSAVQKNEDQIAPASAPGAAQPNQVQNPISSDLVGPEPSAPVPDAEASSVKQSQTPGAESETAKQPVELPAQAAEIPQQTNDPAPGVITPASVPIVRDADETSVNVPSTQASELTAVAPALKASDPVIAAQAQQAVEPSVLAPAPQARLSTDSTASIDVIGNDLASAQQENDQRLSGTVPQVQIVEADTSALPVVRSDQDRSATLNEITPASSPTIVESSITVPRDFALVPQTPPEISEESPPVTSNTDAQSSAVSSENTESATFDVAKLPVSPPLVAASVENAPVDSIPASTSAISSIPDRPKTRSVIAPLLHTTDSIPAQDNSKPDAESADPASPSDVTPSANDTPSNPAKIPPVAPASGSTNTPSVAGELPAKKNPALNIPVGEKTSPLAPEAAEPVHSPLPVIPANPARTDTTAKSSPPLPPSTSKERRLSDAVSSPASLPVENSTPSTNVVKSPASSPILPTQSDSPVKTVSAPDTVSLAPLHTRDENALADADSATPVARSPVSPIKGDSTEMPAKPDSPIAVAQSPLMTVNEVTLERVEPGRDLLAPVSVPAEEITRVGPSETKVPFSPRPASVGIKVASDSEPGTPLTLEDIASPVVQSDSVPRKRNNSLPSLPPLPPAVPSQQRKRGQTRQEVLEDLEAGIETTVTGQRKKNALFSGQPPPSAGLTTLSGNNNAVEKEDLAEVLQTIADGAETSGFNSSSTLKDVLLADPELAAVVKSDPVLEAVLKDPALGTGSLDDPARDLDSVLNPKGKGKTVKIRDKRDDEEKREVVVVKDGNGKDVLKKGAIINSKYTTEVVVTARGVLDGTPQRFAEVVRMLSAHETDSKVRIVEIRVNSAARKASEEGEGGETIKEMKKRLLELLAKRISTKFGAPVNNEDEDNIEEMKPMSVVQVVLIVESENPEAEAKAVLALKEWVRTNAYTNDMAKMGYNEMTLALKAGKVEDTESRQDTKEKSGGPRLNFPTAFALGAGCVCLCALLGLLAVWIYRRRSRSSFSSSRDYTHEYSDSYNEAAAGGGKRGTVLQASNESIICVPDPYSDYSGGRVESSNGVMRASMQSSPQSSDQRGIWQSVHGQSSRQIISSKTSLDSLSYAEYRKVQENDIFT